VIRKIGISEVEVLVGVTEIDGGSEIMIVGNVVDNTELGFSGIKVEGLLDPTGPFP